VNVKVEVLDMSKRVEECGGNLPWKPIMIKALSARVSKLGKITYPGT
jgi:hypothetical protein